MLAKVPFSDSLLTGAPPPQSEKYPHSFLQASTPARMSVVMASMAGLISISASVSWWTLPMMKLL